MDDLTFRLRIFLLAMLAVLVVGTVGFTLAEGLPWADAIYFSVVTITTVGYGDISPKTELGKILALFLIVGGVGTFMGVVANATEMLLSRRERAIQLQKLYVVESIFFSELGSRLLMAIIQGDPGRDQLAAELKLKTDWKPTDFHHLEQKLNNYDYQVDATQVDLAAVCQLLREHTNLLLRLLENPFITEKDNFTECLRAVFHLKDELFHRPALGALLPTDQAHLGGDLRRVYKLLVMQWLDYVSHLSERHPYLFSLAVRMNPFDPERDPVVRA